jgi:hypothetical protein
MIEAKIKAAIKAIFGATIEEKQLGRVLDNAMNKTGQ